MSASGYGRACQPDANHDGNTLGCGPSLGVTRTVPFEHPAGNLKGKSSATSRILVLM
jgi:hypothetical protein